MFLNRNEVEKLLGVTPAQFGKLMIDYYFPSPFRLVGRGGELWDRDAIDKWINHIRAEKIGLIDE